MEGDVTEKTNETMDISVQENPRIRSQLQKKTRNYPSDSREAQRIRNEKKRQNPSQKRGRIEFYYKEDIDKIELFNKMDRVKLIMGEGNMNKISSFETLHRVLDYYINSNLTGDEQEQMELDSDDTSTGVNWYQHMTQEEAHRETMFACTPFAINNIIAQVQEHDKRCRETLSISNQKMLQHTLSLSVRCKEGHNFPWTSSPHTQQGKFLVNLKMAHGFFSSGMLPNQYHKFCQTSGIGDLNEKYLAELQKTYSAVVETECQQSMIDALHEEIASTAATSEEPEEVLDGIGICIDARHCWRKNAEFTDVVCLGNACHKVLKVETISKNDDPCSQRHELEGVKRIYNYLDNKDCPVKVHSHDNNASVIKFVREERSPTQNANDTWHLTKGLTKQARKITTGPRSTMGKFWHEQLSDKAASIRTHVFHSMKNCHGDTEKLKANILTLVSHYKGNHSACFSESRCRTDLNYVPTKIKITDLNAERILTEFLKSMQVYKRAELYRYCLDTHYVESFNNCLLQYHDKRIVFGKEAYLLRTHLSVLDWNENIDRGHTSVREIEDARNPRRKTGIKVRCKKTYNYKKQIFNNWMGKFYDH